MMTFFAYFGIAWLLALPIALYVFGPRAYQMLRRDAGFRAYLMGELPWLRRLWNWLHKVKVTPGKTLIVLLILTSPVL